MKRHNLEKLKREYDGKPDKLRAAVDAAEVELEELNAKGITRSNQARAEELLDLLDFSQAPAGDEPRHPQPGGGFGDRRSEDEKLHVIGEWVQAAIAASCDDPSRRFGQFRAGVRRSDILDAETRAASGMGQSTPSTGGFLVGETLSTEVMYRSQKQSLLWPLCRQFRLGPNSDALKLPYIDEDSRVSTRWGGIVGYWTGEGNEITASQPKLGQVHIALAKFAALVYLSNEVLSDSQVVGELVVQGLSEELAFRKDQALIRGDGAGKPLGLLSAPCLISTVGASSAATIVSADIRNVWSRLHPSCRADAIWAVHSDTLPMLMNMNSSASGDGAPLWIPGNQLRDTPYSTLMGKRLVETEHASTIGTVGDVILFSPSNYICIEKPLTIASSVHVNFTRDETVIRLIYRCNGQPWWSGPLTPARGSTTQSMVATIGTRT